VRVSAQELASGGVLVEVSDEGVGASEARLNQLNVRLDNPPEIDPSVARHMGLFAVARLAERHGIRVRLCARSPRGLAAMVWLPDAVVERTLQRYGAWQAPAAQASFPDYRQPDAYATSAVPSAAFMAAAPVPEPAPSFRPAPSVWFRGRQPSAGDPAPVTGPPTGPLTGPVPVPAGTGGGNGGWSGPAWGQPFAAPPAQHLSQPQAPADADRGERTAAGLPVRVPRANLMPGSFRDRPEGQEARSQPTAAAAPPQPASGLPVRSPERSRSRLGGFQRGTQRAQDQTSGTTEGADH
jgi:hypothetical protein